MPFKSVCCCPQHVEWGFGQVGPKQLFSLTYQEEKYCSAGKWSIAGHKERKRKICCLCRDKIELLKRYKALEAASSSQIEVSPVFEDERVEVCDIWNDSDSCTEHSEVTCKTAKDKACQVPENAQIRQGYECVGVRRKHDIRNEIMCKIDTLLENYTSLGEQGTQAIMKDILSSQKFQGRFADVFKSHQNCSSDDKFLKSLAKDYIAAKDKESSKIIRAQCAKVANKLLIGDSLKKSNLHVSGVGQGKNRIETAQAIGRLSKSGDERRRLLSIVARDFSMSDLQDYFPCSKSTITAARVHAILFGRGGVPRDGLSFTRQAVSPEVIQEFQNFITQDDISRPSSCRSVLVDGKET